MKYRIKCDIILHADNAQQALSMAGAVLEYHNPSKPEVLTNIDGVGCPEGYVQCQPSE